MSYQDVNEISCEISYFFTKRSSMHEKKCFAYTVPGKYIRRIQKFCIINKQTNTIWFRYIYNTSRIPTKYLTSTIHTVMIKHQVFSWAASVLMNARTNVFFYPWLLLMSAGWFEHWVVLHASAYEDKSCFFISFLLQFFLFL